MEAMAKTTKVRSTRTARKRSGRDDHVIPPPVTDRALNQFKLDPENQHQARHVKEYVEWQCAKVKETVTYVEKVKTENVLAIASGSRMAEVRGYLKSLARTTWQLASWLTHAANAVRYDGLLAVEATYAVLNAYGAALLRRVRPAPDRCPRCNSVRVRIVDDPESQSGSAITCESCGAVAEVGSGGAESNS